MLETKKSRNRFVAVLFILSALIGYSLLIGIKPTLIILGGVALFYWASYRVVMWIDKGRQ